MELKSYTMDEIRRHNKVRDCWFIYRGRVYDVTRFLEEHPGGEDVIMEVAGADGTSDFDDASHTDYALQQMEKYLIGKIAPRDPGSVQPQTQPVQTKSTEEFTPMETIEKDMNGKDHDDKHGKKEKKKKGGEGKEEKDTGRHTASRIKVMSTSEKIEKEKKRATRQSITNVRVVSGEEKVTNLDSCCTVL